MDPLNNHPGASRHPSCPGGARRPLWARPLLGFDDLRLVPHLKNSRHSSGVGVGELPIHGVIDKAFEGDTAILDDDMDRRPRECRIPKQRTVVIEDRTIHGGPSSIVTW